MNFKKNFYEETKTGLKNLKKNMNFKKLFMTKKL